MIIPDVNLLIYAYNERAPLHAEAADWWRGLMNGDESVGMPWAVVLGFLRLTTHPAVLREPLAPAQALDRIEPWFDRGHVRVVEPGSQHLSILRELLTSLGVAGNLTTDAHLAALAIEHRAELHSNDGDLSRFTGLRQRNPLL